MDLQENHQQIDQWLRGCFRDRLRPAAGGVQHPYVDPGAAYTDVLWDWDAYFSCVGFSYLADSDEAVARDIGTYAKGCVDNFVEFIRSDGSIPYAVMVQFVKGPDSDGVRSPEAPRNNCKPLLAQFALLIVDHFKTGDANWLASIAPALAHYLDHWYATQNTKWGVLTWRRHRGTGPDNNPAYFQRPHDSVADPYLNALMVRELQAMAEIARRTNGDATRWLAKADALSAAINDALWDPIDRTYYCIDVGVGDPGKVNADANWVVPLKIRSWGMLIPLWAKVAPGDRAKEVIERFILSPENPRSPHGLYTLAKCEPSFQVFTNYNPSDWLGPVWVISTYIAVRALLKYGYVEEAKQMANDHLKCLADDFKANGVLHEYYEPDTGKGLTHPGFVNWNSCAALMAGECAGGTDHTLWNIT